MTVPTFNPGNDPGAGAPRHIYDEANVLLGATVPAGHKIRLQKDASNAGSFAIDFARKKTRAIQLDRRQLLVLYRETEIVGRPAAAQRVGVACQIFGLRPD